MRQPSGGSGPTLDWDFSWWQWMDRGVTEFVIPLWMYMTNCHVFLKFESDECEQYSPSSSSPRHRLISPFQFCAWGQKCQECQEVPGFEYSTDHSTHSSPPILMIYYTYPLYLGLNYCTSYCWLPPAREERGSHMDVYNIWLIWSDTLSILTQVWVVWDTGSCLKD